ncbi:adenosylcobinamide-GDP ribazoletransferase [Halobacillus andaensis]|uniref:Adenosylcobinamide-GDP ribazoletransferase n=1 Tax=Halobacillus andaensis TaxID=1176239 RepID=A0A917BB60_HALAA|nr:adenosylcobinamide-GDP ribazoletransferase [Halobacillus andaensis]MBP2005188.1 adenosylcobinamide-GDP ribazoletransferase [Halobacillus andaensis]GGF29533.1 adenosylcobinamide-GDP ribazoletransferase [Halobacillus andaensis]
MKNFFFGGLFALQFFSIIPVHQEIEPGPSRVRWSLRWLPLVGLGFGAMNAVLFLLLNTYTEISLLSLVLLAIIIPIVLSGGLHLDGLMDTGDAYFSYQDPEKRLDVMKDPRTGAFGVMVLLIVLALRFIFIYEALLVDEAAVWFLLIVPCFARMAMVGLLGHAPSAKTSGLSSFFQKSYDPSVTWWLLGTSFFLIIGCFFISIGVSIAMGLAVFAGVWIIKSWAVKAFRGITGDVCGAMLEGMVTFLWLIIWIFI